jgi:hypothetical protein
LRKPHTKKISTNVLGANNKIKPMNLKNVIFTFILTAGFSSLFANDFGEVSRSAKNNFQKEFATAENVQWTSYGTLTRASFMMNGKVLNAYYTQTGERYALGQNVKVSEMPSALVASIKKSFKHYWITGAFEISLTDDNAYYITVENADEKVVLKSSGITSWTEYKTISKE